MPEVLQADPNLDYTEGEREFDGETPFDKNPEVADDLGGFMIDDDVVESPMSAEEIVESQSFEEMPPGTHRVRVIGFITPKGHKTPFDAKHKDVWFIDGDRKLKKSFQVVTAGVKLAMVDDPAKQVVFFCDLPPGGQEAGQCYWFGLGKETDNPAKMKGFQAKITIQFIEHGLGYPWPKGKPMPTEAKDPRNWLRKEMFVTIEAGKEFPDKATKQMMPGKARVKLFSFRPTEEVAEQMRRAGRLVPKSPTDSRPTVGERADKMVDRKAVAAPKAPEPEGVDDI